MLFFLKKNYNLIDANKQKTHRVLRIFCVDIYPF